MVGGAGGIVGELVAHALELEGNRRESLGERVVDLTGETTALGEYGLELPALDFLLPAAAGAGCR